MKGFTFHINVVFLICIAELKLSYQMECLFKNLNSAETLDIDDLAKLSAKNTLAEIVVGENLPQQITDLNVIKHTQDAGLTTTEIESWIQNLFRTNNVEEDVLGIFRGNPKSESSYLGAVTTAELECAVPPASCLNESSNFYFRSYDGSCNNMEHPALGMAKSRYARIVKPKYGDGILAPSIPMPGKTLPNPRILSLSLYGEDTFSDSHRTYMSMQFGQFVSHDISQMYSQGLPDDCCTNPRSEMCNPIPLHPFGPITMSSGKTCLNFARSLSDRDIACPPIGLPYAEKITTTTAFLDLSSVYGNSLEENIKVRQYKGGLMKTSWFNNKPFLPIKSGGCPANNQQCYNIPDNRNQFTPPAAVLHTLFVREHNRLASILARVNPQHSDERIFQAARKINIAQFQKITYYDWLPLILSEDFCYANRLLHATSPHDYVNDYKPYLNPAPFIEYAGAAFRYLHQSIPGWFSMVSSDRNSNLTMRLSDYFDRQDSLQLLMDDNNFDSLIRGLATQLQKRADSNIDRELKHHFDRKSFEEFGTDLKSLDIQRARDFGIASYNDLREHCGLPRAYQWSDFMNEIPQEKIETMKKFYKSPNDVELSVGGSYEAHAHESMFGPTFQCIIGKQFLRTRTADRFFFENHGTKSGFTRDQLTEIRKVSLAGILCANGNNLQYIQPNVFIFPNPENNLIKCKNLPQLDLSLWKDNAVY